MTIKMQDLLEAGVHFGHQTKRWNPKMKQFIYGAKAGIHIIDLEKTARALNRAMNVIYQFATEGKTILFVSTKSQTKDIIPEIIGQTGMPYMTVRWPGGFLTNFKTIKKRIKYRAKLESDINDEKSRQRFTKKEQLMKVRELMKLNITFDGAKDMTDLPEAVFVMDTIHDSIAVKEANKLGLPVFAICDTNSDPDDITYPIPANDDAIKSLRLIIQMAADTIQEGRKAKPKEKAVPAPVKKAAKPADKPIDKLEIPKEAIEEKDIEVAKQPLLKKSKVVEKKEVDKKEVEKKTTKPSPKK